MARRAQGAAGQGEGFQPARVTPQRRAARPALGQGREELCVRRPGRQGNAGRPVRRAQPAHRLSLHARSRLEGRLPELLVPRRPFRRRRDPPRPARRDADRRFARAARRDRGLQEAHGLEVQMGVVVRQRLQLRLRRLVHPGGKGLRQASSTITRKAASRAKKRPASAPSSRTAAPSITPIRPMRAASTSWSAPTTSSTWRRRAATKTPCPGPWPGCAVTTNTSRSRWRKPAAAAARKRDLPTGELNLCRCQSQRSTPAFSRCS